MSVKGYYQRAKAFGIIMALAALTMLLYYLYQAYLG